MNTKIFLICVYNSKLEKLENYITPITVLTVGQFYKVIEAKTQKFKSDLRAQLLFAPFMLPATGCSNIMSVKKMGVQTPPPPPKILVVPT